MVKEYNKFCTTYKLQYACNLTGIHITHMNDKYQDTCE